MKTGNVDLSESVVIPKEGFYKPNGRFSSVELFSADLSAASIAVELQGSISGETWVTLQESGSDISETLTSGVAMFQTFETDPEIKLRLKCGTATGTVNYTIRE